MAGRTCDQIAMIYLRLAAIGLLLSSCSHKASRQESHQDSDTSSDSETRDPKTDSSSGVQESEVSSDTVSDSANNDTMKDSSSGVPDSEVSSETSSDSETRDQTTDSGSGAPDSEVESDTTSDTFEIDTTCPAFPSVPQDTELDFPVTEDCIHPEVAADCNDGWCAIPPGCFVFGSPLDEPSRAPNKEPQVQVTLTRGFRMRQTEVTIAEWTAMGFADPTYEPSFADKPVTNITWNEALAYCNALSEAEGLDTCYDLSNCTGIIGSGCPGTPKRDGGCNAEEQGNGETFMCDPPVRKYEDLMSCPGYRLPTTAEWEYAARAGTRTATYNGDLTTGDEPCKVDTTQEPITWYCANSNDDLQPVRHKKPNCWGLYDMLGNAQEYVDHLVSGGQSLELAEGKTGPLVDPIGIRDERYSDEVIFMRTARGGRFSQSACWCRAAQQTPMEYYYRLYFWSFRPVQTLPDVDSFFMGGF